MGTMNRALLVVSLVVAAVFGVAANAGAQGGQSYCAGDQSPDYYPCLPATEGTLTCADITFSVHVVGTDTYNLDADGNGIACDAEYGAPVALPTASAAAQATTTPEATQACGAVVFETQTVAPVKIVTSGGNVTETTTDQGTWKVQDNNKVLFTPNTNATLPTTINLQGMSNGAEVVIAATANCNGGQLAQVGTSPNPTPAATATAAATPTAGTPSPTTTAPAPTATPTSDDELAYTGAQSSLLGLLGITLIFLGAVISLAARQSRAKR